MNDTATLSFHQGTSFNQKHNARTITVKHSDISRRDDNIHFSWNTTVEKAYEEEFGEATEKYNSKQKNKSRRIDSYYKKITDSEDEHKKEIAQLRRSGATKSEINRKANFQRSAYEIIISLGNIHNNGDFVTDKEKRETLKKIYTEYAEGFRKRNKKIRVVSSDAHFDELGVPHFHQIVFFWADEYKKGLEKQVSLTKSLEQMGYTSSCDENGKIVLAITKWQENERRILTEIALKHGIGVIEGEHSDKHLSKREYIIKKETEKNEHDTLLNEESASIILSARNEIMQFLETSDGKSYQLQKENQMLKVNEAKLKTALSEYWNEYKSLNKDYWEQYHNQKKCVMAELDKARTNAKVNRNKLYETMWNLFKLNESLFSKLCKIIYCLCLACRNDYLENEISRLQELNDNLKNQGREVLEVSKNTALTLKRSESIDELERQMAKWEEKLTQVNIFTENCFNRYMNKDRKEVDRNE